MCSDLYKSMPFGYGIGDPEKAIVKPETFIYFIKHMTFLSYSFGTLKKKRFFA